MLPVDYLNVLMDTAYPVDQTGWAFYLRLFLLSRKAIIATIKLPKDISKANIPMISFPEFGKAIPTIFLQRIGSLK